MRGPVLLVKLALGTSVGLCCSLRAPFELQVWLILAAAALGGVLLWRCSDARKCGFGALLLGVSLGWTWPMIPSIVDMVPDGVDREAGLRDFEVVAYQGLRWGKHSVLLRDPSGSLHTMVSPDSISPGRQVLAWAWAAPPKSAVVSSGFDESKWLAGNGVRSQWKADWAVVVGDAPSVRAALRRRWMGYRSSVKSRCLRMHDPDAAGLMLALSMGDRSALSKRCQRAFSDVGMAHLTAVSGFHVGCVVSMLMGMFSWVGWPRKFRPWLIVPAIWMYITLCGLPESAVRAGIMASCAVIASGLDRRPHGFSLMAGAGLAMMASSPHVVENLGFRLSFAATAGILLWVQHIQRKDLGSWKRRLGLWLGVSLVATAFTAPWAWPAFGRFPCMFLPANALLTPLVPLLVLLSVVWLALPAGWLGFLSPIFSMPFEAFIECVERCAGLWPAVFLPVDADMLQWAGAMWLGGTALAMLCRPHLLWFLGGTLMAIALLRWQGFQESAFGSWKLHDDVIFVDHGAVSLFSIPSSRNSGAMKWETRTLMERVSHGTEAEVSWCGTRLAFSHCRLRYLHKDGHWMDVSSSP